MEKIVFLCLLVAVIVLLAELYRAPEAQALAERASLRLRVV